MKIAFFHELHFGGARRVVYEYAKVMSASHDVDLYYVDQLKEKEIEKYFNKSYLYKFKINKYVGNNPKLKIYKDFIEPFKLYFLHKKIAKEIDSKNYDFVFVHLSQFTHAPFILRFLKTKNVYFCHEPLRTVHDPVVSSFKSNNIFKNTYESVSRNFKKIIDQSNINHADLVLANCMFTKRNIKKAYGIDSKVCYLGVDTKIFKNRKSPKINDLIFVGEKVWMEGYDTLNSILDSFKHQLVVKIIAPENGKRITDLELAKEYNKSKVLIVLGRFDPFSMIPWEGMSSGAVPVVVNEGGPIEAINDKKTGYLVDRKDIKKFKKVISSLLMNENFRNRIAKNGINDVLNNWTWEKSSKRLLDIVERNLYETE